MSKQSFHELFNLEEQLSESTSQREREYIQNKIKEIDNNLQAENEPQAKTTRKMKR